MFCDANYSNESSDVSLEKFPRLSIFRDSIFHLVRLLLHWAFEVSAVDCYVQFVTREWNDSVWDEDARSWKFESDCAICYIGCGWTIISILTPVLNFLQPFTFYTVEKVESVVIFSEEKMEAIIWKRRMWSSWKGTMRWAGSNEKKESTNFIVFNSNCRGFVTLIFVFVGSF